MFVDQLHAAAAGLAELKGNWDEASEILFSLHTPDGQSIKGEQIIPGSQHSITTINERIIGLHGGTSGFKKIQNVALVPHEAILQLHSSVTNLGNSVVALRDALQSFSGKREVGDIDTASMVVDGVNIGNHLNNVAAHSDAVVTSYLPLLAILAAPDYPGFSEAMNQLSGLLEKSAESHNEVELLKADSIQKRNAIEETAERAAVDRTQIAELLASVNEDRDEVTRSKEQANNQVVETETVVTKAGELNATVEAHKAQFDKYQNTLDEREKQLAEAEVSLSALIDQAKTHDENVSKTIEQANSMIAGATNAGLATTFSAQHADLNTELKKARRGFYFSIGLLAISALPIVAYVFPGIADLLGLVSSKAQAQASSDAVNLTDLLSRFVLLVPFAWLTKFMAARHSTLFKLRENYAYKYSMAMSVEGFKQQAPEFEEQVAMATFTGLSFNPAEAMDTKSSEQQHPNPIIEWLMKRMGINEKGQAD